MSHCRNPVGNSCRICRLWNSRIRQSFNMSVAMWMAVVLCWRIWKSINCSSKHGARRIIGWWGAMLSCRITSTFSAPRLNFRPRCSNVGWNSGGLTTRCWPRAGDKPIWQKDFFDRQLRSGESYHQKWLYIVENPVKPGLVARWEDWPYQGELNVLQWHEPA